ncbi:hypothetical protein RhiirA1_481624 [Rhizophagus irregularis]|uniref:Uncharacterized protein n=1 Tax=Rhizophagus irregularis TaxID=588596 RepID=A0A2N0QMU7_9GLOM|nr:hypothetical protein RhiirA1_481624 [Rhizophagus irregularis]
MNFLSADERKNLIMLVSFMTGGNIMDQNTLLRKMLQFLEDEMELQTEYALAVAEASNNYDSNDYFLQVKEYQYYKGRVKAIRDSIELIEEISNEYRMKAVVSG